MAIGRYMKPRLRLLILALLLAGFAFSKVLRHSSADLQGTSLASLPKDELVLGALHLAPCEIGKRTGRNTLTAYCTDFDVPEDRSHPQGRHIHLKVAVVKSEAANPDADMAVFLDGGPGGSA